ncbi:MAG: hypothetical protein KDA58_13730 [Planctomycetaceae bacterium]|nr:hypothetical protein [Planctomycetaceae bacterium]
MSDDFDDDWDDAPDDDWGEEPEFPAPETVPCWNCGEPVYEGAVQCTACGEYDPTEGRRHPDRPMWYWVLGLIGVLAVLGSMMFAF